MNGSDFLSNLVLQKTYAATTPSGDKETWNEVVARVFKMHRKKFRFVKDPSFWDILDKTEQLVKDKIILGSQRNLQYAGAPVEKDNLRSYNCSAIQPTKPEDFAEIMLLSMLGVGTGASFVGDVSWEVNLDKQEFIVQDTRESWTESVAFLLRNPNTVFDTSLVRPKGAPLSTGGYASGPESLLQGHDKMRKVLAEEGVIVDNRLTLKVYGAADLVAIILELVVAGSSRRSAGIAIFKDASGYKTRENVATKSYRHFLNVSEFNQEDDPQHLRDVVLKALRTGTGDPGHVKYAANSEYLCQACGELTLRIDGGLCNLTTINCPEAIKQGCVWDAIAGAVFLGTLQAAYTDFPHISKRWQEHAEEDALLGVSITGVQQCYDAWMEAITKDDGKRLRMVLRDVNALTASWVGIKEAKRITCGKPEGNTSALLGCTSGAHTVMSPWAIRTVRIEKVHPIYKYMMGNESYRNWVADCAYRPDNTAVISIPVEWENAPDLTPAELVSRVVALHKAWVIPGHMSDEPYTNSISLTVEMKEEEVTDQLLEGLGFLGNFTVLPKMDAVYPQMPFGWITRSQYQEAAKKFEKDMRGFNFSEIKYTDFREDVVKDSACSGGQCAFGI